MRFLLLLSALLSAMVGSGAYARPACALTHQVGDLGGVQAPKVSEAAQACRPIMALPRVVDRLGDVGLAAHAAPMAGPSIGAPMFLMRMRV